MDIKKQKQAFSLLIGMCTCLENALAVWRNRWRLSLTNCTLKLVSVLMERVSFIKNPLQVQR